MRNFIFLALLFPLPVLAGGDAAEARRRSVEARSESPRPGEEVEDADGAGSHGIRVAGRYDTESRLTVGSRV